MFKKIVHCFGTYDRKDDTCFGNEESGEEQCPLKGDCGPFTRYLKNLGKEPREFFSYVAEIEDDEEVNYAVPVDGGERFWKFISKLPGSKHKYRKKKVVKKDTPSIKKRKNFRRVKKIKRTMSARSLEKRGKLLGYFEEFKRVLLEELNDSRVIIKPGKAVIPGQLYVTDKLDTSGYVSLFCRTLVGNDVHIIRFVFKPATMTFDIQIPVEVYDIKDNLVKSTYNKLKELKEIKNSSLRTEIKSVKCGGVALIAEIIARFILDDIIVLPSA